MVECLRFSGIDVSILDTKMLSKEVDGEMQR